MPGKEHFNYDCIYFSIDAEHELIVTIHGGFSICIFSFIIDESKNQISKSLEKSYDNSTSEEFFKEYDKHWPPFKKYKKSMYKKHIIKNNEHSKIVASIRKLNEINEIQRKFVLIHKKKIMNYYVIKI